MLEDRDISGLDGIIEKLEVNVDTSFLKKASSKSPLRYEIVDLPTFLYHKNFLNLSIKFSKKQMKFLEAVDSGKYRRFVLVWGKGSGKDFCSSVATLRWVYKLLCYKNPQKHFGSSFEDSPIDILNVAPSATLAADVYFIYLRNLVRKKKVFSCLGGYEITRDRIRFDKNITAISGHSKGEGLEGYSLFSYCIDEGSGFPSLEELKLSKRGMRGGSSSADYIDGVLRSSMTSRFPKSGFGIAISYPRYYGDYILTQYEQGKSEPHTYTDKGATWEVNPTKKKSDFDEEFKKDYAGSMAKYCCEPINVEGAYFKDSDAVTDIFKKDREPPVIDSEFNSYKDWFIPEAMLYAIHVDLGLKKDACGLVMAHLGDPIVRYKCLSCGVILHITDVLCNNCGKGREFFKKDSLPTVEVDLIEKIIPPKMGEIQISDIVKKIVKLKDMGFKLHVTFDQFQSAGAIQVLKNNNIDAERLSVDRTIEPYETLKELVYSKRLFSYPHPDLEKELKGLVSDGRKVDHLIGMSKDISDGLAGAVHYLITKGDVSIMFQDMIDTSPVMLTDIDWLNKF